MEYDTRLNPAVENFAAPTLTHAKDTHDLP